MAFNIQQFAFWLAGTAIVSALFVLPWLGLNAVALTTLLLISLGIMFALGILNLGGSWNPLQPMPSLIVGVVLLVVGLGMAGLNVIPSGGAALTASVAAPPAPSITGVTVSGCEDTVAKKNPTVLGKAATVNVNCYDVEAANPYSAAVDCGTLYYFETDSIDKAGTANFKQSSSDTSASALTGFKVGQVISAAGGNASYYVDSVNGFCVDAEQVSLNLGGHKTEDRINWQSTIYDNTESVALSAGAQNISYQTSLSASVSDSGAYRIKNNGANKAIRLGGIATLAGTNMSKVEVTDSAFSLATTPEYLKNINVYTNGTAATANTMRSSYTLYKLDSPVILKGGKYRTSSVKYTASSNDPIGSVSTTAGALAGFCTIDSAWSRGADGKMYDDIHDHSTSESNVGVTELFLDLSAKEACALVEID